MNAWNVDNATELSINRMVSMMKTEQKREGEIHKKFWESMHVCRINRLFDMRCAHDCNDFSHGFIRTFDLFGYDTEGEKKWNNTERLYVCTCNLNIFFLPNLCNNLIHLWAHTNMLRIKMKWSDFRKSLCCSHFPQTHIHPWNMFVKHVHTSLRYIIGLARWKCSNYRNKNRRTLTKHGNVNKSCRQKGCCNNFSSCLHMWVPKENTSSETRWFQLDAHEIWRTNDVCDVLSRCILSFDCFYIRSIDLNYLVMLPHIHKISNELGYEKQNK